MPMSMTGYGRAEKEKDGRSVTVEAKSVNHRHLDVNVKESSRMFQLDDFVSKIVKKRFKRGSFDIYVSISMKAGTAEVTLNEDLFNGYINIAAKLAEKNGIEYPPSFGDLLGVRDLFCVSEQRQGFDEASPLIEETLDEALDMLERMRAIEGDYIIKDLKERLALIGSMTEKIAQARVGSAESRFAALKEKIVRLSQETRLDEARIAQEAAIIADRSDVTEELTRLSSHVAQTSALLDGDGPVGRKLEFLLQEMNRETNTIGAKTPSTEVTNLVVDMKSEFEKIREQAQNLE